MNRILKYLILSLTFCLLVPVLSYAAFEDLGCGARPIGMGGAFCGIANDANAFFYNPAGLTQLSRLQISAMYANLYPGLSDRSSIANNFLAIVYPFEATSIGLAWFNLAVLSDPERSNAPYQENTYIFTYAREVSLVSIGVSLRLHSKEHGENYWTKENPVFAKTRSASGVGVDIGILYRNPEHRIKVGFFASDINQPDLGIDITSLVPLNIRAGLACDFEPVWVFNDLSGAADISYRDGDSKVYTGVEAWLVSRTIGIRFGGGFGTNNYGNISMGASYQLTEEVYNNDFRLDYAFSYPLSGLHPTGGTHRMSLTMGFGLE